MIKNKDGSYNKFSLLIVSLIIVIGVSIVGSTLLEESPTIDIMNVAYIGLFISGVFTIYYGKKVFFKPKPTITHVMQTSSPSKMEVAEVHSSEQFTVENEPIVKIEKIKRPREEPTGSGFGLSGMAGMVITLVIGAVTLMVGMTVLNSMMQALPDLPSGSPMSTSLTSITENASTAFNLAAIGMFVIAAITILMTMTTLMRSDDYDF